MLPGLNHRRSQRRAPQGFPTRSIRPAPLRSVRRYEAPGLGLPCALLASLGAERRIALAPSPRTWFRRQPSAPSNRPSPSAALSCVRLSTRLALARGYPPEPVALPQYLIPPLPRGRHWYPHPYKAGMTLPTSWMPHVVGPAIVRRQLDDAGDGVAAVEDSRDSGYDEGTDSREYEAGANHDRVHAVNHRLGP